LIEREERQNGKKEVKSLESERSRSESERRK
jgi:hypothetical protein